MSAQTNLYPIPEFNDKPAYYNASGNSLQDLERSQYNIMAKATGITKAEAGYSLKNPKSYVHIPFSDTLHFIIKVLPGADPQAVVELIPFEVRGDKRVIITSKGKLTGTTTVYEKIEYRVSKIGDGIYLLTVLNLKPGEYFFGGNEYMFAFGID